MREHFVLEAFTDFCRIVGDTSEGISAKSNSKKIVEQLLKNKGGVSRCNYSSSVKLISLRNFRKISSENFQNIFQRKAADGALERIVEEHSVEFSKELPRAFLKEILDKY